MSAALEKLNDPTLAAVRIAGGDWPRPLFGETPIPDSWMSLLITPDGRKRHVPAGEDPRPARDDRLLLVRNRPITVPLECGETPAACGNLVSARVQVLLRWMARESDLAALASWHAGEASLSLVALARVCADDGGREALRQFIRGRAAGDLVDQDQRDELLGALRDGLKRFLFESGAVLERVAVSSFASRTLMEQHSRERDAARRAEALQARQAVEAAAQEAMRQRLAGLGDVLDKLKTAADAPSGTGSIAQLLPALSPTERGRLLENLWRVTPNRRTTQAIVVAAGQDLLWFSPGGGQPTRRVSLPDELGGLRSLAAGGADDLFVGAAGGLWRLSAGDGAILAKFAVPEAPPQRTGFNAIEVVASRVYATHSSLGLLAWQVDDPAAPPARLFEPVGGVPRGVRALVASDAGELLFAADDAVRVVRPKSNAGEPVSEPLFEAASVIHSLAIDGRSVYAGAADGMLLRVSLDQPDDLLVLHRAREAIESIAVRRWFDLVEVVIPAGAGGVQGFFGADGFAVRLMQASVPLRRVWTADDALAATPETRDRVLLQSAASANLVELPIGRLTGRSVQDVCLLDGGQADHS
jgi:hypothetical protein